MTKEILETVVCRLPPQEIAKKRLAQPITQNNSRELFEAIQTQKARLGDFTARQADESAILLLKRENKQPE